MRVTGVKGPCGDQCVGKLIGGLVAGNGGMAGDPAEHEPHSGVRRQICCDACAVQRASAASRRVPKGRGDAATVVKLSVRSASSTSGVSTRKLAYLMNMRRLEARFFASARVARPLGASWSTQALYTTALRMERRAGNVGVPTPAPRHRRFSSC